MRLLILLAAVSLTWALAADAKACSCVRETPEEGFARADAVFSGRIAEVAPNSDAERGGFEVTVEVLEVWKGVSAPIVKVTTAANSAICGYAFQKGRAYLVYASEDGARPLRVSLCSRTQLLEEAKADLKALGKPSVRMSPESAGKKGESGCAVAPGEQEGGGLAWLLIASSLLVWLARRGPWARA